MTPQQFIKNNRIGMSVRPAPRPNPFMPTAAHHWTVTLRHQGRTMQVTFSQGSAHLEPPSTADVMECLAADAAGIENTRSFDEWCDEYGYDDQAHKAYKATVRQTEEFKALLGDDLYETALWDMND